MLEFNFHPFPELQTPRLLLRRMVAGDAPALFALRTSIDVLRYIDRPPHRSQEDSLEMIQKISESTEKNETIAWAITLHGKAEMIGNISYHRIEKENHRAEIGYLLHPSFWRQGFAGEAMGSVLEHGFNVMKLHSIEANVNPDNLASSGLLKKFGFVREAYFRENFLFNGRYIDTEIYSLLEKNYFQE